LAHSLACTIEVVVEILEVQIEVHKIASAQFIAIGSKRAQSLTFGVNFGIFLNSVDFVQLVQSLVEFVWR